MITKKFEQDKRALKTDSIQSDFVIIGGGMAGVCAAIAAGRAGIQVVLVQDRPVLGGNASSEVRLWILGATSHMGNNNRWSREGGIICEILIENMYRNKEGNPVLFDTILLDKVRQEPNITLLLNTAVYDIEKQEDKRIAKVRAFCSQNCTFYDISGNLFCDASGDGILAYRAGAGFWMGAEDKLAYGEKFAPDTNEYGELLGHSIYFYSKDTGNPVKFVPPVYALKDITKIPRYGSINSGEHGCKFWWLEHGGRLDTVHDTEDIKWELWSVVYGVWDHIKNSGKFNNVDNLTLEWVGVIPGKRESRRFVGHYTLVQQDIVEQRSFEDTIAHGGWAIDLHPADGVYSNKSGCIQYHSKGTYEIPYRCFVSKDIDNLFYAGRCISATHVAHGSSRVMATSGLGGQAIGMAAAQCIRNGLLPAGLLDKKQIQILQQKLNLEGQSIIDRPINRKNNLLSQAQISVSGKLELSLLPFNGGWYKLDFSAAQMLPLKPGEKYKIELQVSVTKQTVLNTEIRHSSKARNYTPDILSGSQSFNLIKGEQKIVLEFTNTAETDQYTFVTFLKNDHVSIRLSEMRCTGILTVFNAFNHSVNNYGKQTPPEDSGIEAFEFWCPQRRPQGHNLAMKIDPVIDVFGVENILEGNTRPTVLPNAWVALPEDNDPTIMIEWKDKLDISKISFYFDTDFDHAMESVQMGHPENVVPFCVRDYQIYDDSEQLIYARTDNYETINHITLLSSLSTAKLTVKMKHPSVSIAASLFYLNIE